MTGALQLLSSPFACSLAVHIALRETGLPFSLVRVRSLDTKILEDGRPMEAFNPKGQVPALLTPGGDLITEMPAVLQHVDRAAHGERSVPEQDEIRSWLAYLNSEVHKAVLWFILSPRTPEPVKAFSRDLGIEKLAYLDAHLAGRAHVTGDTFTVIDAYLLWCLIVAPFAGLDLSPWANLRAYETRMRARPSAAEAIAAERLMLAAP